jgi:hypothetical protein
MGMSQLGDDLDQEGQMKKVVNTNTRHRVIRLGSAKLATNGSLNKMEPEEPNRTYDPPA